MRGLQGAGSGVGIRRKCMVISYLPCKIPHVIEIRIDSVVDRGGGSA